MRLLSAFFVFALILAPPIRSQTAPASIPRPDPRYKADILLIIAHPDDDTAVSAYLAKVIEQQHKRVSVVFGTRGNSGGNAVGQEQAATLADIREMEARHSLASLGINDVWFLHGYDTPDEDVLHSLETWGHGETLERVVRLIRLTRPEVVFTWLPDYVVGENHDDHQASAVIATEAFDLAGNPLAFPEQIEAPQRPQTYGNYGEGLRPWQPKKLYYFTDATHFEFLKGSGPEYPTGDISPSRKIPYAQIEADAWHIYKTQLDMSEAEIKASSEMPLTLILAKSLVGGTRTGDVFEAITPGPIPYARARGYEAPPPGLAFELGGPWAFYQQFWKAHNIEHLANLYAPEAQVRPGDRLWVPLLIRNDTDSPRQVSVRPELPEGWQQKPDTTAFMVAAHDSFPIQLTLTPPKIAKDTWQTLTWSAESDGKVIGTAKLRAFVVGSGSGQ
ncbi:MAG TPA: PIG-L family deacetylase [Candidatus Solibacter sp.]|nr:PIG-L family deacetylase [Candidatus Solibacter sp.]